MFEARWQRLLADGGGSRWRRATRRGGGSRARYSVYYAGHMPLPVMALSADAAHRSSRDAYVHGSPTEVGTHDYVHGTRGRLGR